MPQTIALSAHSTLPSFTATAVLQVRPGSDVIADPSPAFKWLDFWNPVNCRRTTSRVLCLSLENWPICSC